MFRVVKAFILALATSLAVMAGVLWLGTASAQAGSKHYHRTGSHQGMHVSRKHGGDRGYVRYQVRRSHPAASSGVMLGYRDRGHREGGRRVNHAWGHREGWHRSFAGDHRRPAYYGPKIIRYGQESRGWRGFGNTGQIAIVVGATAGSGTASGSGVAAGDAYLADRTRLEGRSCAPGVYCTVRLGPYANSPKIITLNTSGKTISEDSFE